MSDKKNIERLFQEKFKDFEVVPQPKVWDNIEAELKKKKNRKVIPLWLRLSGVAAILMIGFIVGDGIMRNPSGGENGVVIKENNQEDSNSQNDKNGKKLVPMQNPVKNNEAVTNVDSDSNNEDLNKKEVLRNSGTNAIADEENSIASTSEKNSSKNNILKNKGTKSESFISNKSKNNAVAHHSKGKNLNKGKSNALNGVALNATNAGNAIAKNQKNTYEKELKSSEPIAEKDEFLNENIPNTIDRDSYEKQYNKNSQIALNTKATIEEQKKDSVAIATTEPNPLEELLLQKEKEKLAVAETKLNRWQITSNVAPIYFGSTAKGSPINEEFSDNAKEYEKNVSYGIGVNYALNNKWAVRGGINKLTLGYNTNNIVYYAGLPNEPVNTTSSSTDVFYAKGSNIIIEDNTAGNTISFENVAHKTQGQLNQTMGFIEVPVELSYRLLDKKFGIELIGGMSTMFLNENNLSVVSNGKSASVGEADNVNNVSFSTNIGLGFRYIFWKSFQANVEPKLKYQVNTFSENSGGFKPYFIGIYSGVSFSF